MISKWQPTILMNFEHNDPWPWTKVVLIWGYCIPSPFSNKKPQDAKMDVSIIYKWRIYFSSGFHVCVLMNSLVLLCHYYWFSHTWGPKGGNFKFLTLTFYPILMQFFWGGKMTIFMDNKKKLYFISKRSPNSKISHIWKINRFFYFSSNFELIVPSQVLLLPCRLISSIFYNFKH